MAGVKSCADCGREFVTSSNRQLRCNPCRFGTAPPSTRGRRPRICPVDGRSFLGRNVNHRFCSKRCASIAARPVRKAKYENAAHRDGRRALEPIVALGRTPCVRCGRLILPGEPWDLGHPDEESPGGPEHAHCNRGAPARLGKKRRRG